MENRRVHLKTFGGATVSFAGVPLGNTHQKMLWKKRTPRRKYEIGIDSGMITIAYEAEDEFEIALFNRSRWVTNAKIGANHIDIGHNHQAKADQVTVTYVKTAGARNVLTLFKIENHSETPLKRIDMRGFGVNWFTIFSNGDNLLMVRPNGDYAAEKLQVMMDQMATAAVNNHRRSEGKHVLVSNDTVTMRRRTECEKEEKEIENRKRLLVNEKKLLVEKKEQLAVQEAKFKEEMEMHETEKRRLCQQLQEVGDAGKELLLRRARLEDETNKYRIDLARFNELQEQRQVPEIYWSPKENSVQMLNERFTSLAGNTNRRLVMWPDGTISIIATLGQSAIATADQE